MMGDLWHTLAGPCQQIGQVNFLEAAEAAVKGGAMAIMLFLGIALIGGGLVYVGKLVKSLFIRHQD